MKKSERLAAAIAEAEQKLQNMADGDYKATAIKVELEAQLNRPDYDDEEYCNRCDGDGELYCNCEDGVTEDEEGNTIDCAECEGSGRVSCEDCSGSGTCTGDNNGWGVDSCDDFMLDNVSEEARDALIYHQFYNDGSVDSEFTFTLPIAKALLAMEFITAFKKLAEEIGQGLGTSGAGMHIAILNDPDGSYGHYGSGNELKELQTDNFVYAVMPLLPALYFLGSADHRSRGLSYRRPWISSPWHHDREKYSAINGGNNCFEFRVFETCYDRPEAFIDFVIVIANCLQFYKKQPTDNSMKLQLGMKRGEGLTRFYYSEAHIKALERGLKLLKPAYKSIATLKAERNFKYSLTNARKFKQEQKAQWSEEYKGAKQRMQFERTRRYHNAVSEYYHSMECNGQDYTKQNLGKTPREYALKVLKAQYAHLYGGAKGYLKTRELQLATEQVEYNITV